MLTWSSMLYLTLYSYSCSEVRWFLSHLLLQRRGRRRNPLIISTSKSICWTHHAPREMHIHSSANYNFEFITDKSTNCTPVAAMRLMRAQYHINWKRRILAQEHIGLYWERYSCSKISRLRRHMTLQSNLTICYLSKCHDFRKTRQAGIPVPRMLILFPIIHRGAWPLETPDSVFLWETLSNVLFSIHRGVDIGCSIVYREEYRVSKKQR